jgi:methylenetetrahydrofolate reductase (NADPH)
MMDFKTRLKSPHSIMSVELSAPKGSDVELLLEWARPLKNQVDVINVPDCQRSILRMNAMAASYLIQRELGIETIWQLTTRDRNTLALQADILGAWALGLKNILCLTGDPIQIGDQADVSRQVSHIEALRLIEIVRDLNSGIDLAGNTLKRGGTDFCYGAALNPHRMSREAQITRVSAKIKSGVAFFQTQPVYDIQTILDVKQLISNLATHYQQPSPKLLIGIIPPKSAEFARFINAKLPGVTIPEAFISMLEKSKNPQQDSLKWMADLMKAGQEHCEGFHVMPVAMERMTPELLALFRE